MARIREVKDIPLDQLTIGKGQVRTRDTGRDIADLAESIRRVGLLEPIVVAPQDADGLYEIITGQRRFLAHRSIGAATILAGVLDEKVDESTAKVISITENLVRLDLNTKDLIDACTSLYRKYGSVKAVAEEFGLPVAKVSEYVKYDRLAKELRDLVDNGDIDVRVALRAQDAASVRGALDVADAVKLAKEMAPMSGPQRSRIVKTMQEQPKKAVDDVIEEAKTGSKVITVLVTLGQDVHGALQTFAKDEGTSQDDAAGQLISDGLLGRGFLVQDSPE